MKATITYDDFGRLDLRVGKVVAAVTPTWSKKLIELTVDFGPEIGRKMILSGIQAWYQPADLVDQHFPFIVNLAERQMGEGVSQGMMLMADGEVDGQEQPLILPLPLSTTPGTVIR